MITNSINKAERHLDFCYFALSKLNIKQNKRLKFYQLLILLSGDISLNPGPCQYLSDKNKDLFEPFRKRGFHFLHINVNSLPLKIDELRDIISRTKPAILGITESKLDSSVSDQEVNISGYSILRSDRNRNGGLLHKLPPPSKKFGITSVRNYYQTILNQLPFKFKFSNVTEDLVFKLLNDVNPDKAAGIDNLSGKFLKDGSSILARPISKICSLSIKYSLFPTDCQIAKLKPLFKNGSTIHPKNYRPISLLPLISKIIEKVIHDQTQEFLDANKILYKFQSGFRKGYFTDSCLSYLNNKIATGFESGLHTGMVLIDLQKAFDTINHEILINKMEFLGFSKSVTLWFKSYLSNRKFKINLNQTFSEPGDLLCGVPQGSILGPLLFLLYINDMPQSVNCELLLYADDTCLIFQHNDIKEIEIQLNKNFSLICNWFVDNKLSIHFGEDKTKSILFSSKRKIKKAIPLNIQYKDIKIKQYSKVTYLGCILDETLSGESMAIHVINKVNSRLRFLYRQNKFLDIPLRRLLCNAMTQPFFDYACNAWYPNLNKNKKKTSSSSSK